MNFPITNASFNLTQNCNLRCSYCFTNAHPNKRMTIEIAKKGVDFLIKNAKEADLNTLNGKQRKIDVSFWGGEPLLEWSLLQDIVYYAEEQGPKNSVAVSFGGTTNATLLTPDKFDFLDKHKIFFMVSFDGTEESHNYYRKMANGNGSHNATEKNFKEALKKWSFYRARISPFPERIDHFYEDCKHIFDLGCNHLMFSPVYENNFTEDKWVIWEEQCKKIVDYIAELKSKGRSVVIEHFKSYTGKDTSRWPCGAGRFYVGIDVDGAIYPCHRFNKFNDERPWQEKEVCIGHVDVGITKPEFREKFIDFKPDCGSCSRLEDTPCHGGCFGINWDFNKDIAKPYSGLCRYVQMQKRVSEYYKEKVMGNEKEVSCMPYKGETFSCECYNTRYSGPIDDRPVQSITPQQVMDLLKKLEKRIDALESKTNS